MELNKKIFNRDFSMVFNEIDKFNLKDPTIKDNLVNDDILQMDESIRVFSEICREINSAENNSTVFLTFS